ncbi:MAG TPA: fumarylacetoacetate hydrolase family protein [Spirochaetia bacterium]|nr:fumarylacetoacetate hydrolase family protein [Spirochaetia bacterium]
MRLARFEAGGRVSWGIVESRDGGSPRVREIASSSFDVVASQAVMAAGPQATSRVHRLDEVRLLSPCAPSKIFALAHNYRNHLQGKAAPREPQIFLKVPSSVISPGQTILLPPGQGRVDEEAELVVVMGKRCKGARRENALGFVLGYTCGNDVSARMWQKNDLNWWRAKSSDTFSPIGPFIVTDIDPRSALITGRINGREVQRCSTADLIFDVPALVEWISAAVTLEPGDLIFTGTSGEPAELHPGDVVEVEIDGIGVLSNPVAEAGSLTS